jgi:hypothetical protein
VSVFVGVPAVCVMELGAASPHPSRHNRKSPTAADVTLTLPPFALPAVTMPFAL